MITDKKYILMIPKIIHYCWFGRNPLPQMALDCISSWRRLLPDYEIKEWNEDNFDVYMIPYVEEAYRLKKYAFVSDFARFWILYNYGGLYFDTDVELLKPIDDIIAKGPFMGMEKSEGSKDNYPFMVAPGLGLGVEAHHPFYGELLHMYENMHYVGWNGKMTGTIVKLISEMILTQSTTPINPKEINVFKGIYIYPDDYFDPMNFFTREIVYTDNTRSIHKYAESWRKRHHNFLLKLKVKGDYIFTRLYVKARRLFSK